MGVPTNGLAAFAYFALSENPQLAKKNKVREWPRVGGWGVSGTAAHGQGASPLWGALGEFATAG